MAISGEVSDLLQYLVIVSCKFNTTRQMEVHAATSAPRKYL